MPNAMKVPTATAPTISTIIMTVARAAIAVREEIVTFDYNKFFESGQKFLI